VTRKSKGYRGVEENNFKLSIIGDLKDSRRAMIGRYNVITGMLPVACSGLIILQVCTTTFKLHSSLMAIHPQAGFILSRTLGKDIAYNQMSARAC